MTATLPERTVIDQTGVFDDIPDDVYHRDPVPGGSLSASGAKKLLPPSCPALFKWERDNPPPLKKAFDFGHAAHRLVLGAGAELVGVDAEDWRTNAAKAAAAEARAEGKVPLLVHELRTVQAMADALRRHKVAASLFNPEHGKPEQSLFWRDAETGVNRRARLDWLDSPGQRRRFIAADYKSSVSANPADFARAMHAYRYHLQLATYLDGIVALGIAEDPLFLFAVQEKTPPYIVTIVQPDENAERIGREMARKALDIYKRCTETGHWPGYSEDIEQIALPSWAERADDNL